MRHANTRSAARPGRLPQKAAAAGALLFIILLLAAPGAGLAGARRGLALCAEVIVPSLFPFLVLSSFLIRTGAAERIGRLLDKPTAFFFRLPGAAAPALALGLLGGYPVGAEACAELARRGALTRAQSERLLSFCIHSSPAYIIGAVGTGLLHSTQAGLLLYLAHVGASLVIGTVLGLRGQAESALCHMDMKKPPALRAPAALVTSVTGAAESMLGICGFVVFFSALSQLLFSSGLPGAAWLAARIPLPPGVGDSTLRCLFQGFLEVSGGCAAAAGQNHALLLLSAFLSWSGLSVVCQVLYAVRGSGLSVRGYVRCRLPHMLLSMSLTAVLFYLFPAAAPAMAAAGVPAPALHNAPASAALLFSCAMLLLSRARV